ncbi:hypothetical protein DFH09DRAFT_982127 [Mycena vulgaris]|nr:hypothetical protein DFH09DRAFT_982127 [Mycena vulgaris]
MSEPNPEPSSNAPVFAPAYPFVNVAGADFILRSSDGAEFYVHRMILSLVSRFFETALGLPQPQGTPAIPAMDMDEDAVTLDRLLRFFYPATQPTIASMDELRELIELLLDKFLMESLIPTVKQHLEKYVVDQSLAVFSVAFKYSWKDVAMAAATESLKRPLRALNTEAPPELHGTTAVAYHNLLHYHYRCGAAAQNTTLNLEWLAALPITTTTVAFGCNQCSPTGGLQDYRVFADAQYRGIIPWFTEFLQGVGALLVVTPGVKISETGYFRTAINKARCGHCSGLDQFILFATRQLPVKIKEEMDKIELKF